MGGFSYNAAVQDMAESTNRILPIAHTSSRKETTEPEDTTKEDIDTFFSSLESELESYNIKSSQEEAKEALAIIEEALNMAPANFYDSGKFSPLKKAIKILSNFDCSSTNLTIEQKTELLAVEKNFKELPERVAKAVHDKNRLTEKESVKLTLTQNLECNLIKIKEATAEVKQLEQKITALHEQVDEAEKNKEKLLADCKEIFRSSEAFKMVLEALGKDLAECEAKAKVAEVEEKIVEAEWGRMKDFISSIKGKIKGNLWNARNMEIIQNQKPEEGRLLANISFNMQEYKEAQRQDASSSVTNTSNQNSRPRIVWKAPPMDYLKVNFDVAMDTQRKDGAIGVVIRDFEGFVLGSAAIKISFCPEAFVSEARAAVKAMETALQMGFRRIILEGDALMIIKKFQTEAEDSSIIGPIIEEGRQLKKKFEDIKFQHVGIQGNEAAYAMAKFSLQLSENSFWFEEYPEQIHQVVMSDAINIQ